RWRRRASPRCGPPSYHGRQARPRQRAIRRLRRTPRHRPQERRASPCRAHAAASSFPLYRVAKKLPRMRFVAFKTARAAPRGASVSVRLNSSHVAISYAVFCLKKKKKKKNKENTKKQNTKQ